MKSIKRLFIVSIIIICSFIIIGCSNKNNNTSPEPQGPIKLSAPILTWDNGTISWNAVDNATKYEVSLNNEITYTYNTSINVDISNNIKHYDVKVKSISEDLNYINSNFSEELKFDTIKLYTPNNLLYKINHSEHKVLLSWRVKDLYADSYELYINGNYHSSIPSNEIDIQINENESYIANNIVCSYNLDGKLFNVGRNSFYIKAVSNNKFYLNSDDSASLWIIKNTQYSNIRVENGQLLYNDNSVYTIDHDAVTEDYNFPVINKEFQKESYINYADYTLWSEPVYVNIYKIHWPRIIDCNKNANSINITIQGYDPDFVGNEPKKILGYDYDKLEFIFYINDVISFSIIKNSDCLDEEIFIINKSEIESKNYFLKEIVKIGVIAHKEGYVSSKIFTYKI